MEKIINVENVTLTIKKHEILKNINCGFEAGKIHGLIGRNGSGKTMLMKCICGFVRPSYGEITVNRKIVGKDNDFPENMGIIIENPSFIPYYSGYKNLSILAGINKKADRNAIMQAMQTVGLQPGLRLPVRKYSLGMKQRLGLAQAIMEDPEILILDEPMNGLDNEGVCDMRKYLLNLREQGKTIIIASHSLEDIRVLCDFVYEMEKGCLSSKTLL